MVRGRCSEHYYATGDVDEEGPDGDAGFLLAVGEIVDHFGRVEVLPLTFVNRNINCQQHEAEASKQMGPDVHSFIVNLKGRKDAQT